MKVRLVVKSLATQKATQKVNKFIILLKISCCLRRKREHEKEFVSSDVETVLSQSKKVEKKKII